MKINLTMQLLTAIIGISLLQSCANTDIVVKKDWGDYKKPYSNLYFKDNNNVYEEVGIEHNAMMDYYFDYIKLNPVNKFDCGDYWEDPDCRKINSAIKSGLKQKALYEKKDSSEYMEMFDQTSQSFQKLKGFQSDELLKTLGETSQYKDLLKKVRMLTLSNLNIFEKNMTELLKQVENDKELDENQKKLFGIGITVCRYSAYYHANNDGINPSLPKWVEADLMGAFEGCIACWVFCPECAFVGGALSSLACL